MADLSILVAQELLRLSEQVTVPTRFYFPSGTFAADVAPAFDAAWNATGAAATRKLVSDGRKRGTAAASVTITSTAANPEKHLLAQYVSKPLRAQTLSGSIRGQFRTLESAAGLNATIQIGVRVVSHDGQTVRATLLAVGGTTTTATTPPEFTTSLTNRRLLTSGDATPLALSSYACVDGDRLVIEIGVNDKSTSTTQTAQISFGDNTVDLPENDTTTTAQDPWVEFNSTIQFTDDVEVVRLSDTGAGRTELIQPGGLKLADGPVVAFLSGGGDLTRNLSDAEALKLADSVTASRDLTANLTEDLKLADSVTVGTILQAFPALAEAVKLGDTPATTLDPEEASSAEALTIAEAVTAMIVLLANVSEAIVCGDQGQGLTSLIGTLRIEDGPPIAVLSSGELFPTPGVDEAIVISDQVTASRGLTASLTETVLLADTVTPSRDLTATPTDAIKLADSPTPGLDIEEASVAEASKIAEQLVAALQWAVAVADETIRAADGTPSPTLDPLEASLAESVRIGEVVASAAFLIAAPTGEAVRISDTLQATLDPLSAAPTGESVHVVESPVSAFPTVLNAAPATELLHVSDRVVILSASVNETFRLSDTGQGATQLLGVLHIQDGPVIAQLGNLISAGPSETLKLADTVGIVRSPLEVDLTEVVKLGWTASEVEYTQDEFLVVQDVVAVALTAPSDLSSSVAAELLRLADTPVARRDLEAAAAVEALTVSDVATMARDVQATPSDALLLADTVTASRDLTGTPADSVRPVDQAPLTTLDPEQSSANDAMVVADSVAVSLGNPSDLSTSVQSETLQVSDSLVVARDLTVALTESCRLVEVLDAGYGQALLANLSEAGRLSDQAAGVTTPILVPTDSDDLLIHDDDLHAVLAHPANVAEAPIRLSDADIVVGMDLATDTNPPENPSEVIQTSRLTAVYATTTSVIAVYEVTTLLIAVHEE